MLLNFSYRPELSLNVPGGVLLEICLSFSYKRVLFDAKGIYQITIISVYVDMKN